MSCAWCSICHDGFKVTSNVSALTSCGHTFHEHCITQWLQTAKPLTCPQCRVRTQFSKLMKLYLDLCDDQQYTSTTQMQIDGTSQEHIEQLQNECNIYKEKMEQIRVKLVETQEENRTLKIESDKNKTKISAMKSRICQHRSEVEYLQSQMKNVTEERKEMLELKEEIKSLSQLKRLMRDSKVDTEDLLSQYQAQDLPQLCSMLAVLRAECNSLRKQKKDVQAQYRKVSMETVRCRQTIHELKCRIKELETNFPPHNDSVFSPAKFFRRISSREDNNILSSTMLDEDVVKLPPPVRRVLSTPEALCKSNISCPPENASNVQQDTPNTSHENSFVLSNPFAAPSIKSVVIQDSSTGSRASSVLKRQHSQFMNLHILRNQSQASGGQPSAGAAYNGFGSRDSAFGSSSSGLRVILPTRKINKHPKPTKVTNSIKLDRFLQSNKD